MGKVIPTGIDDQPIFSSSVPGAIATPGTLQPSDAAAVTVGAYASGNCVGALRTFASSVRAAALGGTIVSALLRDKSGNNTSYDLFLFNAAPTTPTDKTAIALVAADLAKCIGVVQFTGVSLGAAATFGIMTATGVGLGFKLPAGTSLYGILVARGAPVYAATTDVSVDLIVDPD